jgi:DNA-3-methyladenine glycosylase
MGRKTLKADFFDRPTLEVAKDLLGKFLVRRVGRSEISLMIREVEVYDGFKDRASHASRGRTARNFPMFGPPGRWYVYFTYGMHWMLNIVTREEGYPAAILIRGGALVNRKTLQNFYKSKDFGGPAKITKFLKIDKRFNRFPAGKKIGLWMEDRGIMVRDSLFKIQRGSRVGVNYAGRYWASRRWRFWIEVPPRV